MVMERREMRASRRTHASQTITVFSAPHLLIIIIIIITATATNTANVTLIDESMPFTTTTTTTTTPTEATITTIAVTAIPTTSPTELSLPQFLLTFVHDLSNATQQHQHLSNNNNNNHSAILHPILNLLLNPPPSSPPANNKNNSTTYRPIPRLLRSLLRRILFSNHRNTTQAKQPCPRITTPTTSSNNTNNKHLTSINLCAGGFTNNSQQPINQSSPSFSLQVIQQQQQQIGNTTNEDNNKMTTTTTNGEEQAELLEKLFRSAELEENLIIDPNHNFYSNITSNFLQHPHLGKMEVDKPSQQQRHSNNKRPPQAKRKAPPLPPYKKRSRPVYVTKTTIITTTTTTTEPTPSVYSTLPRDLPPPGAPTTPSSTQHIHITTPEPNTQPSTPQLDINKNADDTTTTIPLNTTTRLTARKVDESTPTTNLPPKFAPELGGDGFRGGGVLGFGEDQQLFDDFPLLAGIRYGLGRRSLFPPSTSSQQQQQKDEPPFRASLSDSAHQFRPINPTTPSPLPTNQPTPFPPILPQHNDVLHQHHHPFPTFPTYTFSNAPPLSSIPNLTPHPLHLQQQQPNHQQLQQPYPQQHQPQQQEPEKEGELKGGKRKLSYDEFFRLVPDDHYHNHHHHHENGEGVGDGEVDDSYFQSLQHDGGTGEFNNDDSLDYGYDDGGEGEGDVVDPLFETEHFDGGGGDSGGGVAASELAERRGEDDVGGPYGRLLRALLAFSRGASASAPVSSPSSNEPTVASQSLTVVSTNKIHN